MSAPCRADRSLGVGETTGGGSRRQAKMMMFTHVADPLGLYAASGIPVSSAGAKSGSRVVPAINS
jgi:hypothetical protein